MLTLQDLETEATRFLKDNYDMALSIPIGISVDAEWYEGVYIKTHKEAVAIYISAFTMTYATDAVIYDILRHELIHHALHMRGEPFLDGDEHFEAELRRHGVSSTGTRMLGRYFIYTCDGCGDKIPYHRYLDENEIENTEVITVCCDTKFVYANEEQIWNGEERVQ